MITMDPPEQLRLPMLYRWLTADLRVRCARGRRRRVTSGTSDTLFFVHGDHKTSVGSLQHVTHSFCSCISRASLPPPQPARFFHQYLRLPRRSQLECGKLHANVKAAFAAFRTRLKFVLQSTTTTTTTRSTFSEEASKDCFTFLLSASDNENQNQNEN